MTEHWNDTGEGFHRVSAPDYLPPARLRELQAKRLKAVVRRTDDMLIIRGVNVFPSQIEIALLSVEGTVPHYQIVLTRHEGLDRMEVQVEVTPEVFSDEVRRLENLQNELTQSIENTVGLRVEVRLVEPRTIQRSEGKATRVIDRREK